MIRKLNPAPTGSIRRRPIRGPAGAGTWARSTRAKRPRSTSVRCSTSSGT